MTDPTAKPDPDEILARDIELANVWIDTGIGMAQQAIRAFARGLEETHQRVGQLPQSSSVETLRTMADLLEHLKHEPRRGEGGGEEAVGGGDAKADPPAGGPGPAD